MNWRVSRWLSLVFAVFAELAAGVMYAFSLYSPDLKTRLNFTQSQIQSVGTAGNVGGYFGLPAGIFFDHFGPRRTGLIGATLLFTGYFFMWAVGTETIKFSSSSTTYIVMCIFAGVAGNSNCWLDTTAIVTNSNNFPLHRGAVIGLLKSYLGLAGAVITQIYASFFAPDSVRFLFFIALGMAAASFTSVLFINITPGGFDPRDKLEGSSDKRLSYMSVLIASIAAFLLATSIVEEMLEVNLQVKQALTALMLCILFAVFAIPFLWRGQDLEVERGFDRIKLLETGDDSDGSDERQEREEQEVEGVSYFKAITDPKFILLFFAMFCGSGTGLMLINNLGQLTESLGAKHDGQDVYVSIISVCSCIGRLLAGLLSQKLEGKVSRPWFFFVGVALMSLSHLYMAFASLTMLYVACIVAGISFGSYWALMPAMTADMFGLKKMGSIYNSLGLAPVAGSYLFSQYLASNVYQQHVLPGETICKGQECFRNAFLINAGVDAVGAVLAFVVCIISRPIYAAKKELADRRNKE